MKKRIKIDSLTLIGTRKNYTVTFRDGFNLISGHTSTGKTSILEMIDYALGAKSHKSYIEIGSACSHVELIFWIGTERFKIRRELFNFTAPVVIYPEFIPKECIVAEFDADEQHGLPRGLIDDAPN